MMFGVFLFLDVFGLFFSFSLEYGRTIVIPVLIFFLCLFAADQIRLTYIDMGKILISCLIGVITIAMIIFRGYIMAGDFSWSNESNFVASGGMGPNQVSLLLSIGVFVCIWLSEYVHIGYKLVYWIIGSILSYLMVLTFSRGGVYILVFTILLYYFIFKRPSLRSFMATLLIIAIMTMIFKFAVSITDGFVVTRYSDATPSSRLDLALQGWEIFLDNTVFGIGTANYYIEVSSSEYFGQVSGTHNELVRAAAEHGIFGLLCWILFAITGFIHIIRMNNSSTKALRLALLCIFFSSVFYNALKLTIQETLVLIAFVGINNE
jgi:hypothetical protein